MNITKKFNSEQIKELERIAKRNGFFFGNQGSQELTDDGKYRIHVDFDTGSVATISPLLGQRITESESFKEVDEIYFRGIRIWPLQSTVF